MFDRYTDRARCCIFYAREAVSDYGSQTIETEHLVLGILKEDPNTIPRFLPSKTNEDIRAEVEKGIVVKTKIPTTVDIPVSKEGARILTLALEEAKLLGHPYVGVEHLLLGVLREEDGMAGQILRSAGLDLAGMRGQVRQRESPIE
jgi:ATP-dependent Clp protease ATP-binding subunit ClpC